MPVSDDSVIFESYEQKRLKHLLIARVVGAFILLILFSWFTHQEGITPPLSIWHIMLIWVVLTLIQWFLIRKSYPVSHQLLIQFTADFILLGLLIYASGGIESPLVFLLGVIIIIAGAQARVLLVLSSAVLASATYLISIYTCAQAQDQPLGSEHTLNILLQVSLFFLAGGIMALIAQRHASLQQKQHITTKQHQQLRNLYSRVLQSMQEGVLILDNRLYIQDFNPAAGHILGLETESRHQSLASYLHIPQPMLQFTQQDQQDIYKTELHHQEQYLLITLTRLRDKHTAWLMTIVNISETRELEQKLAKQDKLASLGQMASMLAHEIRNPMQSIAQAVELMGLQQENKALEHIATAEISRLNRLVSDMLDYASPLQPHIRHVSIPELINTSVSHIDIENKHAIQVRCSAAAHLNIDPDHFRLVVDNLLRNAIQASPDPATISISFQCHNSGWELRVQD